VTADTERRPLPEVFTVFATQNPIDFEGTYPLPEAQLDRFLMKIRVGYPTLEQERLVLERHHAGFDPAGHTELIPVPAGVLAAAQAEQRLVRIEPELYEYLLGITRRTREWPSLTLGASPRAAISLMRVAQSYAALDGRDFIIPDDVKQAALPVLRHRVMLRPEAELEGLDADRVLTDVIAAVPVPRQTDPVLPTSQRAR
jgi:MoxR-like ATPase